MATECSRDMYLDIMGVEFEFDVEFEVYSFGSPDSWQEPGDPAELSITSAINKLTGVDWRDKLGDMKDLSLKYHTNHITKETKLAYGYGFKVWNNYNHKPVAIILNDGRSLLDVLEAEIHENLNDHLPSYDDYGDY